MLKSNEQRRVIDIIFDNLQVTHGVAYVVLDDGDNQIDIEYRGRLIRVLVEDYGES